MARPKFVWIDVVAADARLTTAERFVLVVVAVTYVRINEDVFRVRQTTIAERFAVSERTVRAAIANAQKLGYLVLDQPRKPRGRSHHAPDQYRLLTPADAAAIDEERPAGIDTNTGTDRQEDRQESTQIPARVDASTSGNAAPIRVLDKGFEKGLERGSGGAGSLAVIAPQTDQIVDAEIVDENPDPEPPDHCREHMPYGTADWCGRCKTARLNKERWQQREGSRTLRRLFSFTEGSRTATIGIADCGRCDDHGWLLGPDGTVVDPAVRCRHDGGRP